VARIAATRIGISQRSIFDIFGLPLPNQS